MNLKSKSDPGIRKLESWGMRSLFPKPYIYAFLQSLSVVIFHCKTFFISGIMSNSDYSPPNVALLILFSIICGRDDKQHILNFIIEVETGSYEDGISPENLDLFFKSIYNIIEK